MIGDTGATQNSTTANRAWSGARNRDISRWNTSAAPRPAASGDHHGGDVPRHGEPREHADEHRVHREERPGVLGDVPVGGERQLGRIAREPDDLVPAGIPDVRVLEEPGLRRRPRIGALHVRERQHDRGRHRTGQAVHEHDLRPPGHQPPPHARRGARHAERVALPFDRCGGHPDLPSGRAGEPGAERALALQDLVAWPRARRRHGPSAGRRGRSSRPGRPAR